MKKFACFLLLLGLFAFGAKANENENMMEIDARTFVVNSAQQMLDFQSTSKELIKIEESLKSGNFDARTISGYVSYLANTGNQLIENRRQLDNDLKNINRRIESLGEMPKMVRKSCLLLPKKEKNIMTS